MLGKTGQTDAQYIPSEKRKPALLRSILLPNPSIMALGRPLERVALVFLATVTHAAQIVVETGGAINLNTKTPKWRRSRQMSGCSRQMSGCSRHRLQASHRPDLVPSTLACSTPIPAFAAAFDPAFGGDAQLLL